MVDDRNTVEPAVLHPTPLPSPMDAHRPDAETSVTLSPYGDADSADTELKRLRGAVQRTTADVAIWVLRNGPELCGYESTRAALADILDVGRSQVQRILDYISVVGRLSAAAGITDADGMRDVAGLTTVKTASTLLKPRLPAVEAEVLRQASEHDADQQALAGEILPRVVAAHTQDAKRAVIQGLPRDEERGDLTDLRLPPGLFNTPPGLDLDELEQLEATEYPEDRLPVRASGTNPRSPFEGETADAAPSSPPASTAPAYTPCPACGGTGRIAASSSSANR